MILSAARRTLVGSAAALGVVALVLTLDQSADRLPTTEGGAPSTGMQPAALTQPVHAVARTAHGHDLAPTSVVESAVEAAVRQHRQAYRDDVMMVRLEAGTSARDVADALGWSVDRAFAELGLASLYLPADVSTEAASAMLRGVSGVVGVAPVGVTRGASDAEGSWAAKESAAGAL